jgi:thymidylate synthase (FAD)
VREAEPRVHLVARTQPDEDALFLYLESVRAGEFAGYRGQFEEPHDLVEIAGRMCYRSWQAGLNPNVTKVRLDQRDYLENIVKHRHGSVLEHVSWTFILQDISRIVTHELVRHRVGVAISQESLRYVRLDEIPFWLPEWARADDELVNYATWLVGEMEKFQGWAAGHFGLDHPESGFEDKKHKTSFMRRFAPEGLATSMTWTANARTLRHVIETRTAPGAEEEIRLVFDKVAATMTRESPMLFGDFSRTPDGAWVPKWSKV